MARLPYPPQAALPDEVLESIDRLPARLNVFLMAANAPTTVPPLIDLGLRLLGTLHLPPTLREMVILWTGFRSRAAYEVAEHLPVARACEVSEEQIAAIGRLDPTAPCFTAAESAALSLTDQIARGTEIPAAQVKDLTTHFSNREIVELTVLAGYYLMLARLLTTLDVDDDGFGPHLAEAFQP